MGKFIWQIGLLLIFCMGLPLSVFAQTEQENTVRAVLFYSPTCPHCHTVINEVLIPLVEAHEDQLEILAFDVTQATGQQFYQAAIIHFEIPEERLGVPALVVGNRILVGSSEIPDQFPTMVEEGLGGEGIPWPAIPGLAEALAGAQPEDNSAADPYPGAEPEATAKAKTTVIAEPTVEAEPTVKDEPAETAEPAVIAQTTAPAGPPANTESEPTVLNSESGEALELGSEKPAADPLGFAIAAVILIIMVVACGYVAWRIIVAGKDRRRARALGVAYTRNWAIPVLALAGLGVAAYLVYVELTHVDAVCGPVGQCNIVQSSTYAHILGMPVALLGLASYIAILALWLAQKYLGDRLGSWPTLGLMALTIFGTLFSIYLTLLELFVIHAVCAWCLTSAVIMLLLMLLVVVPATAESGQRVPEAV